MQLPYFQDIVQRAWDIPVGYNDSAKLINAKFKNLKRATKLWAKNLQPLKKQIQDINDLIFLSILLKITGT